MSVIIIIIIIIAVDRLDSKNKKTNAVSNYAVSGEIVIFISATPI